MYIVFQLVTENESLKKECVMSHAGGMYKDASASQTVHIEDRVRHLEAQNSILQKHLTGIVMDCAHVYWFFNDYQCDYCMWTSEISVFYFIMHGI